MSSEINIGSASASVIIGGSVTGGSVSASAQHDLGVFGPLKEEVNNLQDSDQKEKIRVALHDFQCSVGSPRVADFHDRFVSLAAGYITLTQPVLAALRSLLP